MISKEVNVVFGGWYQRTTLHLSEVQRFLVSGHSDLELDKSRLKKLKDSLNLKSVRRVVHFLEYLDVETKEGIRIKYFEDGLYILSWRGVDIEEGKKKVRDYFDKKWKPATDYLFSLGAPTPKILSNMKEVHPFVIERVVDNVNNSKVDKKFGEVYLETVSNNIKVSKTKEHIFIDVSSSRIKELETLTEMQIFFSDFKLQLHKYLDIHRKIWEEIEEVKEKKVILGKEIGQFKSRLDTYQKTIQLISNRINQMSNYAKTRRDISKKVSIDDRLNDLFQYRFEDLFNTLEYIKEVWMMTLDYVNSAIRIMDDVAKKNGEVGLKSIQFLVGVGVVSGFVKYLGPAQIPDVALSGILYIVGFGIAAILIDKFMVWRNNKKKYGLGFVDRAREI